MISRECSKEDGQAMAEYALLLAVFAAGLFLAFTSLGQTCLHLFQQAAAFAP